MAMNRAPITRRTEAQPPRPARPMAAGLRKLKDKATSRGGRVLLSSAVVFPGILVAEQAPASAGACSNSSVMHVWTERYGGGHLAIRVIPTTKARTWGNRTATNDIWHSVQQCVGGLYGSRADGVYQQIQCHVRGTLAGGYSWDFETWRTPTSWDVAYVTKCNWGGWPYRRI